MDLSGPPPMPFVPSWVPRIKLEHLPKRAATEIPEQAHRKLETADGQGQPRRLGTRRYSGEMQALLLEHGQPADEETRRRLAQEAMLRVTKEAARLKIEAEATRKRELADQVRRAALAARAASVLQRRKQQALVNENVNFELRRARLQGKARVSESTRRAAANDAFAHKKKFEVLATAARATPWGAQVLSPVDATGKRQSVTSDFVEKSVLRRLASMPSMEMRRHQVVEPEPIRSCEPHVVIATLQARPEQEPWRVRVAQLERPRSPKRRPISPVRPHVTVQHTRAAPTLAPPALDASTPTATPGARRTAPTRPKSPVPYSPPWAMVDDVGNREQRLRTQPTPQSQRRRPQTAGVRSSSSSASGIGSQRPHSAGLLTSHVRPTQSLAPPEGYLSLSAPTAATWVWD